MDMPVSSFIRSLILATRTLFVPYTIFTLLAALTSHPLHSIPFHYYTGIFIIRYVVGVKAQVCIVRYVFWNHFTQWARPGPIPTLTTYLYRANGGPGPCILSIYASFVRSTRHPTLTASGWIGRKTGELTIWILLYF